jgi:serine/threonine-protein kinase
VQLALARIHSRLVPLRHQTEGYVIDHASSPGWFELHAGRGLAGYGLARALRLLLDVLSGLSALHDTQTDKGHPFTHGELVPALVRVDSSGAARLIPLAPWHSSTLGKLPSPERIGHLAPERLLGDTIDQRADVFSAGVLLWEALAGRRLFEADSVDEIITRLMGGRVTLPALPPELAWAWPLKDVAMCALAVDPEQRFSNLADFAEAIETVAAEHLATHAEVAAYFGAPDPHARPSVIERPRAVPPHNSSLSALVSPAVRAESAPASGPTSPPETPSRAGRGKGQLWAGAAALSLLLAVGVGVGKRSTGRAQSPPVPRAAVGARSVVERLAIPSSAPAIPSSAPSATFNVAATPSVSPAVSAAAPSPAVSAAAPSRRTNKVPKTPKAIEISPPRLKTPAKPAAGRGREAEQYGI